jgi:hypothetical protein
VPRLTQHSVQPTGAGQACYHNLVLTLLPDKSKRPTANDYRAGWTVFFQLIGILKPTHCVFAGTDGEKLVSFNEVANERNATISDCSEEKIGRIVGRKLHVKLNEAGFDMIFIKHPGKYFPWSKWSNFIYRFVPSYLSDLDINHQ